MDSTQRSILVMDANQRSALAVTRALGAYYTNARVMTADDSTSSLAASSRFSSAYLQYPSPSTQPAQFIAWVEQNCLNGQFDLVLPTTEVTSQLLLMNRKRLTELPLAFADYETVMAIANKSLLVKSAITAGVPVPKSQFFEQISELDIAKVEFPCVLKPSLSKILEGNRWIATTVRILKSLQDLQRVIKQDSYLNRHSFMIQEFIPGHGAGLFCLYHQGKAVQYFAHQRLREKPPEGGVSVLSQAAPLDPKLKQYATALLDSVQWHGVAMVEFRITEDGTPYLMEVNTRFWGSLQLAIDAGVNFPVQLATGFFGEPVVTNEHYNEKQRLRWLMGDIDSLYIYLKRPNTVLNKLKRVMTFCWPQFGNLKYEVNRLSDMKPFWFELRNYFKRS